ncbi:hypothetical protein [Actinoallomurus iriomotensis]|nr:hypothetical protein [Actinoallomurus iriomotensis]
MCDCLASQGKEQEISEEMEFWQALRPEFGDGMIGTLLAVCAEQ